MRFRPALRRDWTQQKARAVPAVSVAIPIHPNGRQQHLFWWSTGLCMREFFYGAYSRVLGIFLLRAHRLPALLDAHDATRLSLAAAGHTARAGYRFIRRRRLRR